MLEVFSQSDVPVHFENGSGGDLPLATIMMVTLLLYLVLMLVVVSVLQSEMVEDSFPVCRAACSDLTVTCSECCSLDCRSYTEGTKHLENID